MQIIVFLLGLSLLITIHELGHFICAKIFGVYCHEFSIGMGPAIISKQKGETKYSIRWLPIGGYVSMAGEEVNSEITENDDKVLEAEIIESNEDNNEENKEIVNNDNTESKIDIPYERTINGIKPWKRFIVISAGVVMNFVLAYILFFIYILSVGVVDTAPVLNVNYTSQENEIFAFKEAQIPEGRLEIDEVDNNIVFIYDGKENIMIDKHYTNIESFDDASSYLNVDASISSFVENFSSDIKKETKDGYEITTFESQNYQIKQNLKIISDNNEYRPSRYITKLVIYRNLESNEYTISEASMNKWGYTQCSRKATFGECVKYAGQMELQNGLAIFDALGKLFTKEGINNVGGVIAMADASNTYLEYGFGYYMAFLGLISVNLGVMNLLPIPGLDGSQLLVIIAEGITRKKLPNNAKAIINFIGLIFLLGLMILITIKDVFTFLV